MKPVTKIFTGIVVLFVVVSGVLFTLSQQDGVVHRYSVVIDAPQEEVWAYLSENHHAKMWSVFFDHITTLPSDDPAISEGGPGSVRRCFRMPDETGISWDEVTVKIEPYQFRQIHTYNIQNWPFESFNELEFNVYQTYEKLGENQTRLEFATDLKAPQSSYAKWMFYSTKFGVERVFRVNLENIKAHIEQGQIAGYDRPHAWEPPGLLEQWRSFE